MLQKEPQSRRTLIPPDVTPDHVLGLAEILFSLGNKIDPMYVGDAIGENIDILPHAIDLAEALNIIEYRDGTIVLTNFGVEIVRGNTKVVKKLLRWKALELEPLNEIVRRLKSKGCISVEEYSEIIKRNYSSNDQERAFKNVLIWGAFLKIFRMSEDDKLIVPIDLSSI